MILENRQMFEIVADRSFLANGHATC
jgi:hypothetical protein